jgi:DNA-binding NarL/FixJ family response regulator
MNSIVSATILEKLKVLVVDDHPLYRKAVAKIINSFSNVAFCDQAENGKVALDKCKLHNYNIILLDITMPVMDGITALHYFKRDFPCVKIIILTMHEYNNQFIELINLGVSGYLLKSIDEIEIKKAFKLIMEGGQYFTPLVYAAWLNYIQNSEYSINNRKIITSREMEVLTGICLQLCAKEIGIKYFISEHTVNNHRSSIMKKLKIDNTVGLVLYAVKNGIFLP